MSKSHQFPGERSTFITGLSTTVEVPVWVHIPVTHQKKSDETQVLKCRRKVRNTGIQNIGIADFFVCAILSLLKARKLSKILPPLRMEW